jgi:hypothetical protein
MRFFSPLLPKERKPTKKHTRKTSMFGRKISRILLDVLGTTHIYIYILFKERNA